MSHIAKNDIRSYCLIVYCVIHAYENVNFLVFVSIVCGHMHAFVVILNL